MDPTYVIGPNGTETELNGNRQWVRTHVPLSGSVSATFDPVGVHFQLADWLGTRRVQTNYLGQPEVYCSSMPFGDQMNCQPVNNTVQDASNHNFTGYERDPESGNDFAQARHFNANLGSFMSPDPSGLYFANPANPQSLNLYTYVQNNPLRLVDPSGMATVCTTTTTSSTTFMFDPTTGETDVIENVSTGPPDCYDDGNDEDLNLYTQDLTIDSNPTNQAPAAPSKVGCGTVLPNGKTVGQYINQGRAQLQAVIDNQNALAAGGGDVNPFALLATFANIARDYGQIDFKNGAAGTSVLATNLGLSGNFAYYAIGSGYFSPTTLDLGASAYSHAAALLGRKPFSSLTGPLGIDASAASVRNTALATPGCPG